MADWEARVGGTSRCAAVGAHYGRPALASAILHRMRTAGKDLSALTPDDLTPVGQLHLRQGRHDRPRAPGRPAERWAGARCRWGPRRPGATLAAAYGCGVTVLDLTQAFCRAGVILTERTGRRSRESF